MSTAAGLPGLRVTSAGTFAVQSHQALQYLANVLMTPHVSEWTEAMPEARAKLIAENIHQASRGDPPVHLIPALAD